MTQTTSSDSFVPNSENTRQLRDAFGRFATGVTIVTTMTEDGPIGITANSFSSVSLDPPLVLWAPDKKSRRSQFFVDAKHYVIHVLSSDQSDLCWNVAKDANGLRDMDLSLNQDGQPIIDGCLARFECTQTQTVDAGDHTIILGLVNRANLREEGESLAFFKGKMGRFTAES
jgi:flavin reductase (DIM6/NTAB) family NADH-FMN oxidoreductase RutF